MDKVQALHAFWNSFGIPAYDENSVPQTAVMPYITYTVATDSLGNAIPLSGNIWYRERTWKNITQKADEIARAVSEHGYYSAKLDNGYMWLTGGSPFAQRMTDTDPVKRIYINIMAEFLTAY